jgi:hypothetical protein
MNDLTKATKPRRLSGSQALRLSGSQALRLSGSQALLKLFFFQLSNVNYKIYIISLNSFIIIAITMKLDNYNLTHL